MMNEEVSDVNVSILIPVYNEEKNIKQLLLKLLNQKEVCIKEIIVISSGSTDKTNEIVKELASRYRNVILITEDVRRGKAHAINLGLNQATAEVILLISGDTLPANEYFVYNMVKPFVIDPKIGVIGCCILPTNKDKGIINMIIHIIWKLHNKLNELKAYKFGECIAFRRSLIKKIPEYIIADEAYIQYKVLNKGYKGYYARRAVLRNKGPEILLELLNQRSRVYIGHIQLKKLFGFKVPSFLNLRLIKAVLKLLIENIRLLMYLPFAIFIELLARIQGIINFNVRNKVPYIWRRVSSSKAL